MDDETVLDLLADVPRRLAETETEHLKGLGGHVAGLVRRAARIPGSEGLVAELVEQLDALIEEAATDEERAHRLARIRERLPHDRDPDSTPELGLDEPSPM